MRVIFVDITKSETPTIIIEVDVGGVAPNVGDFFDHPDLGEFRVVQRAFTLQEVPSKIEVVGVVKKRSLEAVLQVACTKVI